MSEVSTISGEATAIRPGRVVADPAGEVVVFLIGMRINRWRALRQWLPVFTAMPPMIGELLSDPSSGCLSVRTFWSGRIIMTVQYWSSTEQLLSYARGKQGQHLPAWRAFNRRAAASSGTAVGIFHETYAMPVGSTESVYRAMPPFGLAAATRARLKAAPTG
jgi:hypothetical protein